MQIGTNASTMIDGWLDQGRDADTVLIAADDREWSAGQLASAVSAVATFLTDLGVLHEDRILLVLDDTPSFPAAFLAAMRIGAVPVPVNFLARDEDFGYFMDDSSAVAAIVDAAFLSKVGPQVADRPHIKLIVANGSAPENAHALDDVMDAQDDLITPVNTKPTDMGFWLYSSGSTGVPKGVVHSHGDIVETVNRYAVPTLGIDASDKVFSSTKLFHAYGLGNNLTFPMSVGATSVYLTGRPTPDALLKRVADHRPSLLFSVPALYNAMLANPAFDSVDWSSVRLGVSAAEALPPEIWRQFHDRTGVEILDGVGSTEMLHIYCTNRAGSVRPGTSGTPVDGYEVEIRDPEDAPVDPGEAGEMWVKGPSTLSHYWNQPERSADKIRGDWFLTGDRYRQDAEGYFIYEGRVDDMMKIGGLWVSPIEIENRLMEHDAVQEAAVVEAQIDLLSRIKAFVILSEGTEDSEQLVSELQEWCKTGLQRYQYPHHVEFVSDFPRTTTGKIQRFKLRDEDDAR